MYTLVTYLFVHLNIHMYTKLFLTTVVITAYSTFGIMNLIYYVRLKSYLSAFFGTMINSVVSASIETGLAQIYFTSLKILLFINMSVQKARV